MGACTAAAKPWHTTLRPDIEDVEGFAVAPEEFIGSGASVAAIVRYTGTGRASGKALNEPVVHVWELRDGKLARFRQFIDTVKFARSSRRRRSWLIARPDGRGCTEAVRRRGGRLDRCHGCCSSGRGEIAWLRLNLLEAHTF